MMTSWIILIFILVLAISAYVAAVERALSSVNKITVRTLAEGGDIRAADLLDIIEDPGTYMLALRSCIVLLHTVACIIALYGFLGLIEEGVVSLSPWQGQANFVMALIVLILLLALVLYSFTELLPRRIAVLHEEGIALSSPVHRPEKTPRFQIQLDKWPLSPGTPREASGVPCLDPRRGLTLLSQVCRDLAIGV